MPRYRFEVEYDGSPFSGWQIQPGVKTIQAALESALQVLCRTKVPVMGSGRTDAGVHARGQVAHFDLEQPLACVFRTTRALNGLLHPHIAVRNLHETHPRFHARYDAILRMYRYQVATAPMVLDRAMRVELRPVPDFERMNDAAKVLLGTHHFGAFCRTKSETENRVCTLFEAAWHPEERIGMWHFRVSGNRFLHGMVRALVGTLLQIGRDQRPADDLLHVLSHPDRTLAGPAAPAHGLILEEVHYPSPLRPKAGGAIGGI